MRSSYCNGNPGTTRDLLRENILIDGIPVHIIDTADLRESVDDIEREGMRRAWKEIEQADQVLFIVDSQTTKETDPKKLWQGFNKNFLSEKKVTVIHNKIDLSGLDVDCYQKGRYTVINLSAKKAQGIDLLRQHLKQAVGADNNLERNFIARRRH